MKKTSVLTLLIPILGHVQSGYAQPTKAPLSSQEKYERVQRMSVDELIAELEQKPGALGIIHKLRRKGDKKAIPTLKTAFGKNSQKLLKQASAAALVSLGEEGEYLDYLISFASAAVYSDMPVPMALGDDGQPTAPGYRPEFLVWCKSRGVDPDEAARKSVYEMPGDVMMLGVADTKKAIPIFMDGLKSENDFIVKRAAQGLAQLRYGAGSRAIVKATGKRKGNRAASLAETLAFFDDDESKSAFEKNVKNDVLKKAARKRAQERATKNVWGED